MLRAGRNAGSLWRGMRPVLSRSKSAVAVEDGMARMAVQAPTHVTELANGVRVASEKVPGAETATVGVYLYTGTRFETPETNGVAHFLEHLIFKGTKKTSQYDLEKVTENIGAHLNAYTSREQTVYFGRSLKKDVPKIVGILSDIVQNPTLDSQAVERERDVILREHMEISKQMDETVFDYLHEVAYQNTPLAKTILGTAENIKTLTVQNLRDYINTHYKPHRMVIAAAGAVDHDELVKMVEKDFGSIAPESDPTSVYDLCVKDPAYLTGSEVRVTNDHMPVAHFALAFESVGWSHPDSIAFMVFQALLGNYERYAGLADVSNLRLPRSMAMHADHCKSFSSFNTTYTDTGLFGVYGVAEPPEMEDACMNILSEMVRPVFKLDEAAVERAKLHIKTSSVASLDGNPTIAEDIGRQVLTLGRRMPMSEFFARVDEVDSTKLKEIADHYIFDREIAFAAMGQVWALPDYGWLRRRTYWNSY